MTDNFDRYREFIEICGGLPDDNRKGILDKYYVIELMRRGKDNPDLPAANFHFKNYYIYSWKDLDRYKDEVKKVCELLNMRAYCSVNYKLMTQVALDTLAESARRIALHDYKKFYSIFESCSGKFSTREGRYLVVDVDDIDEDYPVEALKTYINSTRSKFNENVIYTMPTRSGFHIIARPFDIKMFKRGWKDNEELGLYGIPDIKENHLTLLYENLR